MIPIQFLNQNIDVEEETTPRSLFLQQHTNQPHQGLGAIVNGELVDIDTVLPPNAVVEVVDFDTDKGKEIFWHTSAHVLAQAVKRIWPQAQPTIGPAIKDGFYYDFANLEISEEDLPKIEKVMQQICQEGHTTKKIVYPSPEAAKQQFIDNPYKIALINAIEPAQVLTGYQQGEFIDLCRGPHLPSLKKIKAIKLTKTSGAYWRGDANNPMLTRIYGVTYPDKALLKAYLQRLEEAQKRDHRRLGMALQLFGLKEEAPGLPFFYPRGMRLWNKLVAYWGEKHKEHGYAEIKTPTMLNRSLWERSGHWEHYHHNMYTTTIEEKDFAIKPMNCPGAILYYQGQQHSYRELPIKVAELGLVHRYEASGALSGLFRVRGFHQDDAHLFLTEDQIGQETTALLKMAHELYQQFGLSYTLELSTRPDKDTIGTDAQWELATNGLEKALRTLEIDYKINAGDGAFYGPKIDLHVQDAIGRSWQCGTIQLDLSLPQRFSLEYTNEKGQPQTPVLIHRAIFGSLERFLGILIEHYAGKFPLWCAPTPVVIMSVADRHHAHTHALAAAIEKECGIEVDTDCSDESLPKKVRKAQLNHYNYMITVGDNECASNHISVRLRSNVVLKEIPLETFIQTLIKEKTQRLSTSPFEQT